MTERDIPFMSVTYVLGCADSLAQNKRMRAAIGCLCDALGDMDWQSQISGTVISNKISGSYDIGICLRLFRLDEIGNHKSFARYVNQKKELIIDAIFILDDYLGLDYTKLKYTLYNEIFHHLQITLLKYDKRLLNSNSFNVKAFIPLLKSRIEDLIANQEPYIEPESDKWLNKTLESLLNDDLTLK